MLGVNGWTWHGRHFGHIREYQNIQACEWINTEWILKSHVYSKYIITATEFLTELNWK